jgi:hypothetical protein
MGKRVRKCTLLEKSKSVHFRNGRRGLTASRSRWRGKGRTRMGSHEVNNPAGRVFHDHKHIKSSESGTCDDAEVTGDNGLGVILEKGWPTLFAARVIGRCPLWLILRDRTRRHAQGEFQQQLANLCRSMMGLCRMSLLYSITIYKFGIPPCVEHHRVFVAKLWAM